MTRSIITLPEHPIDGYEIHLWRPYMGSLSISPVKETFVYYVNRPWKGVEGHTGSGAPLVDCWLGENCRILGWTSIVELTYDGRPYFTTEIEAIDAFIADCTNDILRREEEVAYLRSCLEDLQDLKSSREATANENV